MLKLSATLAVLLCGAGVAAAAPAAAQRWKLDNGLEVVFVADRKAPLVAVSMVVHAGGKDEPVAQRGLAHLFEHMMFKGSRRVPSEGHWRLIAALGGKTNAETTLDYTRYWEVVPAAAVGFALDLEAERLRNLTLTQANLDVEREVIKEEIRLKLEGAQVERVQAATFKLAYTTHPYREVPGGSKGGIDTITLPDAQRFYDTYYQPNNVVLVVVGDVDEKTLRALVQKAFGGLPRGPDLSRPSLSEPAQTARQDLTVSMPVETPMLVAAYHVPPARDADRTALQVLAEILSGSDASRLRARLMRKDKLVVEIDYEPWWLEDGGLLTLVSAYVPSADPARVRAAILEEIARLRDKAPPPAELLRAKNALAARAVFRNERIGDLAGQLSDDVINARDVRALKVAAALDAISAADVQRVAKKYLAETQASFLTITPEAAK